MYKNDSFDTCLCDLFDYVACGAISSFLQSMAITEEGAVFLLVKLLISIHGHCHVKCLSTISVYLPVFVDQMTLFIPCIFVGLWMIN